MPHRAPPIPPAQRAHPGEKRHIEGPDAELQPGDADAHLRSQGRQAARGHTVDTVPYKHQAR